MKYPDYEKNTALHNSSMLFMEANACWGGLSLWNNRKLEIARYGIIYFHEPVHLSGMLKDCQKESNMDVS